MSPPPLKIYNTAQRRKQLFAPLQAGHVGIYVCGPTVYDLSHIGHARVYVCFDTIVRFLRRHYQVLYVRNYTDIDDKIIKRAQEKQEAPSLLAQRFIDAFEADMRALGCLPCDVSPRVTEHVGAIIALIERLIAADKAYQVEGNVYYAVENFATYGQLSQRSLDDMEAGARVEVVTQKRHPMDFALWKAAKPQEVFWHSPWGNGRPGWHIECSAMAHKYLGVSFDLHGGGRDLLFPHHENEIAQSEGAFQAPYVQLWMHNGLVNVDNTKMSKSLGNFFTVRDVLHKFDAQTLRFYLLSTHYRSPMQFSDALLSEAESRVKYFYETLQRLGQALANDHAPATPLDTDVVDADVADMVARFEQAMLDDFNTPQALGDLSHIFKKANEWLMPLATSTSDAAAQRVPNMRPTLRAMANGLGNIGACLGLFLDDPAQVLARIAQRRMQQHAIDAPLVERLLAERLAARRAKDFGRADALRQKLHDMGIEVQDNATGASWSMK